MTEENENNSSLPELGISGNGTAENEVQKPRDGIEYGGGSIDPMEELALETSKINQDVQDQIQKIKSTMEKSLTDTLGEDIAVSVDVSKVEYCQDPPPSIDPEKIREIPDLSEAQSKSFDPSSVQDPRQSDKIEGGVVASRSTGPAMSSNSQVKTTKSNPDGGQLKTPPNLDEDSAVNMFEVSGFTVQYKVDNVDHTVQIRDYFNDLATAFASVNSVKYLMPMQDGYKISTITSGAPIICYNDRQLYMYKDEKWLRT